MNTRGITKPVLVLRAEHAGDALRRLALPVRPRQQVEPGLGAVHLAEVGEAVGAQVDHLVDPEAVAEVRHLDHDWLHVQADAAGAVDHVLVRTRDHPLLRLDVVAQHAQAVERRHRHDAAHQARFGQVLERQATVVDVDHRPGPEIGFARDHAGVCLGDARARDWARDR